MKTKRGLAIPIVVLLVSIVACGTTAPTDDPGAASGGSGQQAAPTSALGAPTGGGQDEPSPEIQTDRLPRPSRASAATLSKDAGTDPCSLFPKYTGNETRSPDIVIDVSKGYSAWIVTAKGEIVIDLFANTSPATVNNFMFLACNHFYDGLTFHRVLPDFVVQGGDPNGNGTGGPPYTIPDEFNLSDLRFDKPGLLSMAHTSMPNSAGSQFFITLADNPSTQNLSGAFTIFGEVVNGMDVALAITPRDPDDPATSGNTPDVMKTIIVRQVSP